MKTNKTKSTVLAGLIPGSVLMGQLCVTSI